MERPTWSNYATHDESARPHLWNGCVFAAAPCLGPTGPQLIDLISGRRGAFSLMDTATDWVVSSGSYGVDFDGFNDTVSFGTFPIGLKDATISLWVLNRGSTAGGRFIDRDYQTGFWAGVNALSGSITSVGGGFVANASPYGSYCTITSGVWNHVAIKRVGAISRAYANGSNSTSSDYDSGSTSSTATGALRLGTSPGEQSAGNCIIDDVRIYNRPLSDAEIRELAEFRGAAYERRSNRRYIYQTDASIPVTGTVAVTLDNLTAVGSGTSGTGGGTGLTASQPLAFNLSDSLVIGG